MKVVVRLISWYLYQRTLSARQLRGKVIKRQTRAKQKFCGKSQGQEGKNRTPINFSLSSSCEKKSTSRWDPDFEGAAKSIKALNHKAHKEHKEK